MHLHGALVEDQQRRQPIEPVAATTGAPPFETAAMVETRCQELLANTMKWLKAQAAADNSLFAVVEPAAVKRVFELGRMLLLLFLTCADERVAASLSSNVREFDWTYDPGSRKPRRLGTFFGKIWFWRSYMEPRRRDRRRRYRGYFPVERILGLTRDGFSMFVIKLGLRLTVELPFALAAV